MRAYNTLVLLVQAAVTLASPTKRAPRAIVVGSVTELGPVRQNSYVRGRDNGQSVLYGGKSYWFFDDTFLSDGFLYNTAVVTTDLDASNNIDMLSADWTRDNATTARPGTAIPFTSDETNFQNAHSKASSGCTGSSDAFCNMQFAHWPCAVISDPDRTRILVGYDKLCRASEGSNCANTALAGQFLGWGWFAAYPSLGLGARLNPAHGGVTDATGLRDTAMFGGASSLSWTRSAVVSGANVYLYAVENILSGSKVAKVPLATFHNTSTWTYWNGSTYQSNVASAVGVMAVGAAGSSVFYSAGLGGCYHVYSAFGSNTVQMQSAPAPEGPWSNSVKLFDSIPSNGQTNYAAFAHPEYASADGLTQYITYYQTGTMQQRLVKVVLR